MRITILETMPITAVHWWALVIPIVIMVGIVGLGMLIVIKFKKEFLINLAISIGFVCAVATALFLFDSGIATYETGKSQYRILVQGELDMEELEEKYEIIQDLHPTYVVEERE